MPLTDTAIRAAKPAAKTVRLYDSLGLYLEVAPSGSKWWRFKYKFKGKEKRLSLGVYPKVALKEARSKRAAAQLMLQNGVDPSVERRATKNVACKADEAESFEAVAREWFASVQHRVPRHAGAVWHQASRCRQRRLLRIRPGRVAPSTALDEGRRRFVATLSELPFAHGTL
jgi:hypothetical protein